ncbi:MAG: glutathione S-transferase family protein [Rhizobiales bacterium]|nr:glutathione S-transferase family protein [Hyphomicrobiales bacterium]MBI3673518.1 glutathione S-transferase family protein [Hyphomicrobiales bacterium]
MYKLYNVKAWGSMGVHFLLEEMEVPYTNIWMTAEQVRAPEFRAVSPLGYIPALGLPDGRGLFESAAIVSFLVTAHADKGLSPAPGSAAFGEFLSWLHLASGLYTTMNIKYDAGFYGRNDAEAAHITARVKEKCDALWAILAARLEAEEPWFLGKIYSALDTYVFMLSIWASPSEAALHGKFPAIARLAKGVRQRPKLKAALEAHGVMEVKN